jgi:hypothetical protein
VSTQPEALRLADDLEAFAAHGGGAMDKQAAAELRRQHAEIERLRYENEAWETAVRNCLAMSNGRESEWGLRAQSAFTILHNAIARSEEVKP